MNCQYCGRPAELITGKVLYRSLPLLAKRIYWRCEPCHAHVGCHPGTETALGSLANSTLRGARSKAHSSFDMVWKSGKMSRSAAYSWLAGQMGLEMAVCHIGGFDLEQCQSVLVVMRDWRAGMRRIVA